MSDLQQHQTVGKLFSLSFSKYTVTFKSALIFILIAAVIEDTYLLLGSFNCSAIAQAVILPLASLIALYFWCCAVLAADRALKQTPISKKCILWVTLKKMVNVITVVGLYLLTFIASIHWLHYLAPAGAAAQTPGVSAQSTLTLLLVGLPLLAIYLSLLFVIPMIVTSEKNLIESIKSGVSAAWRNQLKTALSLYFGLFVLASLIWPFSGHAQWLYAHHIKLVFDVVVLAVLAPVVINFMLLALHNPAPPKRTKVKKGGE